MMNEKAPENDMFFDAVSTTSQDEPPDDSSKTSPVSSPAINASQPAKRTVLTYSDRNGLKMSAQTTPFQQQQFDPNDDFALSNKLNSIVLSNSLELHHFVFHNDMTSILTYIKRYEHHGTQVLGDYLSIRDLHGNTPLHLATMMGHKEVARILTKNGAVVKARNRQLWTPLNEAISFGDRELIRTVLVKFENEVDQILADSKPKIVQALEDMLDFYVEANIFI